MKKSLIILLNTICGGILAAMLCIMLNYDLAQSAQYVCEAQSALYAALITSVFLGSIFGTAVALYAYAREEA